MRRCSTGKVTRAAIKPWLRDGVTWQVGDASDPNLITSLGPQDLVVANNFLCHMPAAECSGCACAIWPSW